MRKRTTIILPTTIIQSTYLLSILALAPLLCQCTKTPREGGETTSTQPNSAPAQPANHSIDPNSGRSSQPLTEEQKQERDERKRQIEEALVQAQEALEQAKEEYTQLKNLHVATLKKQETDHSNDPVIQSIKSKKIENSPYTYYEGRIDTTEQENSLFKQQLNGLENQKISLVNNKNAEVDFDNRLKEIEKKIENGKTAIEINKRLLLQYKIKIKPLRITIEKRLEELVPDRQQIQQQLKAAKEKKQQAAGHVSNLQNQKVTIEQAEQNE